MNSLGRHYRDPSNPAVPHCNYEVNGTKCNFFASGNAFAELPYPDDISFGPVSADDSSQSADMTTLLALMNKQIQDQAAQSEQMKVLQQQVSSLLSSREATSLVNTAPFTTVVTTTAGSNTTPTLSVAQHNLNSSVPSCIPLSVQQPTASIPQIPALAPNPTPPAVPQSISAAAANLAASLQASLSNPGATYNGITMDHLRANPSVTSQANVVLSNAVQGIPPLNPPSQIGSFQQVNSVDQLFKATTVNKQLRAYEFAQTGQFSYHSQLKQDNVNAVAFAYGSMKHLEACKTGLIPNVSDSEFLNRLRHLRNVFEIACLSSSLTSFSDPAWLIAREYDTRVISDIESGAKSWTTLSNGIEPDSIYCAKETVDNRQKAKKANQAKESKKDSRKEKKACTTYNTHRSSEGCYWESQHQGETCVFEHYCSWCKQNRNAVEKHKALNCEFKSE